MRTCATLRLVADESRALIGTAAAAAILGMPEWMVRDRARVGLIPCHRRAAGGKLLFVRAELEGFQSAQTFTNKGEIADLLREQLVELRKINSRLNWIGGR